MPTTTGCARISTSMTVMLVKSSRKNMTSLFLWLEGPASHNFNPNTKIQAVAHGVSGVVALRKISSIPPKEWRSNNSNSMGKGRFDNRFVDLIRDKVVTIYCIFKVAKQALDLIFPDLVHDATWKGMKAWWLKSRHTEDTTKNL
jgi:hypothetical protein